MKIALVRCPWITTSTYPPDIGFVYIYTILKAEGYEVSVFDLNIEIVEKLEAEEEQRIAFSNKKIFFELEKDTFQKYGPFMNEAINRIIKFEPDVVGFCVWESNKIVSLELAKRLKQIDHSVCIIFGGPDCFPLFSGEKLIAEKAVDLVIYGEAEITIKKVLDSIKQYGKVLPARGVIYKSNGRIIDCGPPELVENLDTLPLISLDGFSLESYNKNEQMPISFNRGCPYKCEYCPREMYPKFRSRTSEHIIKEIEDLQYKYGKELEFFVCDSAINNNPRQLDRVCDLIFSKGLKLSFGGFACCHPGMSYEFLLKLKKAGFNSFVYGVESGSEKILSKLGKKIKVEDIERIIRDTHKAGIKVGIDILVGLPGETEEDFAKSVDFLIRNREHIENIGICNYGVTPYSYIFSHREEFELTCEETKIERIAKLNGIVKSMSLSETVPYRTEKYWSWNPKDN